LRVVANICPRLNRGASLAYYRVFIDAAGSRAKVFT
jgi:hypothetical protein